MAESVSIRRFGWDDLPAVVEMVNQIADYEQGDEHFTPDTFREELTNFNDPEADCFVAAQPDGRIVGYAYVERRDDEDRLWGYGWGGVHPDVRRQGIGRRLVRAAEGRFREWTAALDPGDKVIFLQRYINDAVPGESALARAEGYTELRSSYRMQIELDTPVEPPVFPAGIALRPFDLERDLRAVYEVDQTGFMDGGNQAVRMPFEDWRKYYIESPGYYNPALWLVAVEGDEIAGICINHPWGEDQPDLAWVGRLAVLRPWRGRGIGSALLRHSFYVIQQHSFQRAGLGVRAELPETVAIYQRAGMQIYTRFVHYRKVLHGDPAQIQS